MLLLLLVYTVALLLFCPKNFVVEALAGNPPSSLPPKFIILGGTGKIGTAVAAHLLQRLSSCEVVLVGRRSSAGQEAMQDVQQAVEKSSSSSSSSSNSNSNLSFEKVEDIWDGSKLAKVFRDATGVIHTAGPYSDKTPTVLDAAIAAQIPIYVDVSDPIPFLAQSLERHQKAVASQTTALCAAGAFPGMSNVLAMEAAAHLVTLSNDGKSSQSIADDDDNTEAAKIQDVRFHYFTKGLGGSGTINLYITNVGFGDPMTQHDQGQRRAFTQLSGKLLGSVDFFISGLDTKDNTEAKERLGTIQQVFAWPFPEAATVASHLDIKGSSSAAMGTAPDLWNTMLGLLVDLVPRRWWRNPRFSKFMADFSQPLVLATDAVLQQTSPDKVGETHAMRIDVTTTDNQMASIVQAHESFRQCVGQSCAEFALDLLEHPCPGVYLPEQRYEEATDRQRIIEKLTSTPGTFCYTGPVQIINDNKLPIYPSNIVQAVQVARQMEAK